MALSRFAVLGSGGWGTALSVMLNRLGHTVAMWSPFDSEVSELVETRENRLLLPGVIIDKSIDVTTDIECVKPVNVIIMAVPSFAVRSTAARLKDMAGSDKIIVNVAKGLENKTNKRLSVVIGEELPGARVVVLSGPSHAEEVSRGVPTSVVAASTNLKAAEYIQDVMMSGTLRIYTNPDIIGVELGGALKNVIAIASGACEGLGLGDNTRAALLTRAVAEITKLGMALGARRETFDGLAGLGDLIVTCMSVHSRNRQAGVLLGRGRTIQQAMQEIGKTVEGYHAARVVHELAHTLKIEMPIFEQCYEVFYNGKGIDHAIYDLMRRPKGKEINYEF